MASHPQVPVQKRIAAICGGGLFHNNGSLSRARRLESAVTLLELLLVMVIMTTVGALVIGNAGWMRAGNITSAGRLLMEDVSLARELAIAGNQPAEIWFLRPAGGSLVTGMQIYLVDQNGLPTPYGEVHRFALDVGGDTGEYLSPMFKQANSRQWTGNQIKPQIPGYGTQYDCWYVRFMPDGSTTLTAGQQWYLTLHDVTVVNGLGELPHNYAILNINPVSGKLTLYRP